MPLLSGWYDPGPTPASHALEMVGGNLGVPGLMAASPMEDLAHREDTVIAGPQSVLYTADRLPGGRGEGQMRGVLSGHNTWEDGPGTTQCTVVRMGSGARALVGVGLANTPGVCGGSANEL